MATPSRRRGLPSFFYLRATVLALLVLSCLAAVAQTTTISGTVFDPRATNALPLPNVLVYVTTNPVDPLPSGVQCLQYQAPNGAGIVSYTYTDVQGKFTLSKVPQNADYTLVIQAGKWRNQFPVTVATDPVIGLGLHMPANHTQGDIPMIAIATGSVDAVECVLRDMGIADTEFTDDNGTVNPGGRIHLYRGSGNSGAQISTSTPMETALTGSSSTLNGYDMVMFPCQSTPYVQTATPLNNLLDFANAGGRLFTTHYSYVYIDPNAPYNSPFAPVANWQAENQINSGLGTVSLDFSDGATLAQWLQNAGATYQNSVNQIQISTLRTNVASVIAPTQSWVTLNSGTYAGQQGNPVMQMTFNAPVGAPAAQQCGRVMYNDYHVYAVNDHGMTFPSECPDPATHVMSAQEKMLEYALFDLSTFVQPVVVPTIGIAFTPSPVTVKEGDSADQVVVSVTNTSSTTEIGSSAILSFALPQLLTATAMTDSTGGWNCNVAKLACTRTAALAAGATDSVTLTFGVAPYPAGGLSSYVGTLTATVASVTFSNNVTASDTVIYQQPPPITWPVPAPIVYGTPLSSTQLDASTTIAGTFTYTPSAGTVLAAGKQTLSAHFVPDDTTHYTPEDASVTLTVLPATPVVQVATSSPDVFLTTSLTFTATTPAPAPPDGTITFYDGATALGTAPLNAGSATFSTATLTAGDHSITAVYSGDSNYGTATSAVLKQTVQDFTLTAANGGAASVLPASQVSLLLTVTPVGGTLLPGALDLSFANLPAGVSAQLTPASINANAPATSVTLQVRMSGSAALERPQNPFGRGALPLSLGLLMLPFSLWRRGRRSAGRLLIVLLVSAAALSAGLSGCGGAGLAPHTFAFPVTARSGGLSHSLTVQITVTPQH